MYTLRMTITHNLRKKEIKVKLKKPISRKKRKDKRKQKKRDIRLKTNSIKKR